MHQAAQKKLSVYKTKQFGRFARRARIYDADLWETARLVHEGSIDADLGGGVIKQRIARAGEGKSGGSRSIILFRFQGRAVFVYGFEKKDLGNIKANELEAFGNWQMCYLATATVTWQNGWRMAHSLKYPNKRRTSNA